MSNHKNIRQTSVHTLSKYMAFSYVPTLDCYCHSSKKEFIQVDLEM